MMLQPQNDFSIPEETAGVARSAFPNGNLSMNMHDAQSIIYQDQAFAHVFPENGRLAEVTWQLAFITVLQFVEELPDRQAADAVRGRIDLKYALSLELSDPGFDFVPIQTSQINDAPLLCTHKNDMKRCRQLAVSNEPLPLLSRYTLRQGIEATISQGIRAFGMRRSRSISLDKTH